MFSLTDTLKTVAIPLHLHFPLGKPTESSQSISHEIDLK